MLKQTHYTISSELIQEALSSIPDVEFRLSLNQPTNDFFYDSWVLKPEFQNTVWQKIYDSLPIEKGEARIIKMEAGNCYASHADVDDRFHLNLSGNKCYLIDLDNKEFHQLSADCAWYDMDAGRRHSAANFGNKIRYQLVVRKLLIRGNIENPIRIKIKPKEFINLDTARFIFDDTVSPWLNQINKQESMNNFKFENGIVSFDLESNLESTLKNILPDEFYLEIR